MIEKIKSNLLRLFAIVFTITFLCILFEALFKPSSIFFVMKGWNVVLITIIVFSFLFMAYHGMGRLKKRGLIIFTVINFFVFTLFQLIFIRYFQVNLNWDVAAIYQAALEQKDSFQFLPGYFTWMYPNNIPILIIYILGMRFLDLFGVTQYYYYFTFFNAFVILLSMGGLYWLIYRHFGLVSATWTSLFMLFLTPLYMFVPIVYTDTLVMLFPILGLILYDLFYHSKNKWCYLYLILLGLVLAIGVLVKTNAIIIVVAIIIHSLMRSSIKKMGQLIIGIVFSFLLVNGIYQSQIKSLYPSERAELGFPMTHWIMMGLRGNGGYSREDVEFTDSLKNSGLTNSQIKAIHIEQIKNRLSDYGVRGTLDHLHRKINYTWADGTYYVPGKLSWDPIDSNPYQAYIYGDKKSTYMYLSQAIHSVVLGLMTLSGIYLFKNKNSFMYVAAITLFGNFLFLLIWETRSRYLVLYLPLMMMLCTYAMASLNKNPMKGSREHV